VHSNGQQDSPQRDDQIDLTLGGQEPKSSSHHLIDLLPQKLSTTFEASVEESVSYVKLHPPTIENGSAILPEQEEEEEEDRKEEEKMAGRKASRTEEVFPSLIEDDDRGIREKSCDTLDLSDGRVSGKSISSSPQTSEELDHTPADGGQSDSLLNLYQGEELDKPRKKRKWKLFRKRKITTMEDSKAERSQSDAPLKSEGVGREGNPSDVVLRPKVRSVSADTLFDTGVRVRSGRKVDRYTQYMQDYTAKLEEQKMLSPKQEEEEQLSTSQGSGLDEVDRGSTDDLMDRGGDATPPAEMTSLTFRQSLFCNQLKYKLRSALQNIRIPLTLSPTLNPTLNQPHLQGELSFDTRNQLILLIQHALQRSQWMQDDMETALLTEILRMVEPLPCDL
jgi:hypothetical protein